MKLLELVVVKVARLKENQLQPHRHTARGADTSQDPQQGLGDAIYKLSLV